ncbi:MAG TPA: hypothetical protein VMH36_21405 [Alphaproteobacteria bacterium]|nr:hypothetical protein [Alphaproteobacteria bacterium]
MGSPDDIRNASRGFWIRHSQILATLFVAGAAAVDFGPDSWIEWVLWGTTIVSVAEARIILAVLAVLVAVAVMWPFIRPTHPRR